MIYSIKAGQTQLNELGVFAPCYSAPSNGHHIEKQAQFFQLLLYQNIYRQGGGWCKKPRIISWKAGPCSTSFPGCVSVLGTHLYLYPLALLWQTAFSCSEISKDFQHFCPFQHGWCRSSPARTELSVQQFLTKNGLTPTLHLLSPDLAQSNIFCLFLWMKKVLRGKYFTDEEELKQKMEGAPTASKLTWSKTVLSSGKVSIGVLHQIEST